MDVTEINLKDAEGRLRARLALGCDGEPFFALYDAAGTARVGMTLTPAGAAVVACDPNGFTVQVLTDEGIGQPSPIGRKLQLEGPNAEALMAPVPPMTCPGSGSLEKSRSLLLRQAERKGWPALDMRSPRRYVAAGEAAWQEWTATADAFALRAAEEKLTEYRPAPRVDILKSSPVA